MYHLYEGTLAITARAEVRFRRPARIGEPLAISATVTSKAKKLLRPSATISRQDGTVVAEGAAVMVAGEGDW